MDQSALLVEDARGLNPDDIRGLMGVSEQIAHLNHERFMNWQAESTSDNAKQAVLAFKGDVYTGLQAETLSERISLLRRIDCVFSRAIRSSAPA